MSRYGLRYIDAQPLALFGSVAGLPAPPPLDWKTASVATPPVPASGFGGGGGSAPAPAPVPVAANKNVEVVPLDTAPVKTEKAILEDTAPEESPFDLIETVGPAGLTGLGGALVTDQPPAGPATKVLASTLPTQSVQFNEFLLLSALVGTDGDDSLEGTAGTDNISGLAGDDTIDGLAGNDILGGGAGNDDLDGGEGDDDLFGGAGTDYLTLGDGADYAEGGDGIDMFEAEDPGGIYAPDTIDGGAAYDEVYYRSTGGDGIVIDLETQENGGAALGDVLLSVEGIGGTKEADTMRGDANDNTLAGFDGYDRLFGRDGNDRLDLGKGGGVAVGGAGIDTIYMGSGHGSLVVTDWGPQSLDIVHEFDPAQHGIVVQTDRPVLFIGEAAFADFDPAGALGLMMIRTETVNDGLPSELTRVEFSHGDDAELEAQLIVHGENDFVADIFARFPEDDGGYLA